MVVDRSKLQMASQRIRPFTSAPMIRERYKIADLRVYPASENQPSSMVALSNLPIVVSTVPASFPRQDSQEKVVGEAHRARMIDLEDLLRRSNDSSARSKTASSPLGRSGSTSPRSITSSEPFLSRSQTPESALRDRSASSPISRSSPASRSTPSPPQALHSILFFDVAPLKLNYSAMNSQSPKSTSSSTSSRQPPRAGSVTPAPPTIPNPPNKSRSKSVPIRSVSPTPSIPALVQQSDAPFPPHLRYANFRIPTTPPIKNQTPPWAPLPPEEIERPFQSQLPTQTQKQKEEAPRVLPAGIRGLSNTRPL
eukprot:c11111_g1_i1.p1 GENE.c11111_g1_i1~~c11111_g1_i1.p1  ORF type:complete len:322 (+),score=25.67 c11111_g1_i1:39-968(+)